MATLTEKAREQAVYEAFGEIICIEQNIKNALAKSGQLSTETTAALAGLSEKITEMENVAQGYRNAAINLSNQAYYEYRKAADSVDDAVAKKAAEAVRISIDSLVETEINQPISKYAKDVRTESNQVKVDALHDVQVSIANMNAAVGKLTARRFFFSLFMVVGTIGAVWAGGALNMKWTTGDIASANARLATLQKNLKVLKAENVALKKGIGPIVLQCPASNGIATGPCVPIAIPAAAAQYFEHVPGSIKSGHPVYLGRLAMGQIRNEVAASK